MRPQCRLGTSSFGSFVGTSESRVKYVVEYMYVLGSFYESFYKYVHVLIPLIIPC